MKKIMFFDIDGVLTATDEYFPDTSPELTKESLKVLKEAKDKGFILVFITARSVRELRLKNGFEKQLRDNNLLENNLIFGALGLDMATKEYEFKTKEGKILKEKGNALFVKKAVVRRETFSNLDHYLLYKMLLGKEIKQNLKYAGYKVKPAIEKELVTDARIMFEFDEPLKKQNEILDKTKKIIKEQREIFKRTNKFGSPVELDAYGIPEAGYPVISIQPIVLGKHLGILRALNALEINPKDKIFGYAFGDRESDRKMKIRKDIEFIKVKNNKEFVKKIEEILKK
jgi:hydroxymethylpyrimidine pyrophosphatase-like HAD family hydrolase